MLDIAVRTPEASRARFLERLGDTDVPIKRIRPPAGEPWPTELAGCRVSARIEDKVRDLPVGEVTGVFSANPPYSCFYQPAPNSGTFVNSCDTLIVRTQFPFDAPLWSASIFSPTALSEITVAVDGVESKPVLAYTTSWKVLPRIWAPEFLGVVRVADPPQRFGGGLHWPNRARAGELLAFHVTGIGLGSDAGNLGIPGPEEPVSLTGDLPDVRVYVDFAAPHFTLEPGVTTSTADRRSPAAVFLKPGEVGIYEVRFTMPPVPAAIGPCTQQRDNARVTLDRGINSPPLHNFKTASLTFCASPEPGP